MTSLTSTKYVLEMKTVQIAPVRTLMTALKDILLETNIVFSQDYTDQNGNHVPAGIKMEKFHLLELELLIWINRILF